MWKYCAIVVHIFTIAAKLVTTLLVLIILQFWKELQEIFKIMEFNSNHTEDIFIFEQISKDVFNIERHYCLTFVKLYTECQISPCQHSLCYPSSCRPSSCQPTPCQSRLLQFKFMTLSVEFSLIHVNLVYVSLVHTCLLYVNLYYLGCLNSNLWEWLKNSA